MINNVICLFAVLGIVNGIDFEDQSYLHFTGGAKFVTGYVSIFKFYKYFDL